MCSEEMANEEGKSTGDIISLIFKGQSQWSCLCHISKKRQERRKDFFFSYFIEAAVHTLNCLSLIAITMEIGDAIFFP